MTIKEKAERAAAGATLDGLLKYVDKNPQENMVKLLDISREYWLKHGVNDWGLVIDEE
ncbi:MAG: hypothetical protein IJB93_01840 [Clostridia bacterium]|nr:hypothetical protein [Clostridia bacterium]